MDTTLKNIFEIKIKKKLIFSKKHKITLILIINVEKATSNQHPNQSAILK